MTAQTVPGGDLEQLDCWRARTQGPFERRGTFSVCQCWQFSPGCFKYSNKSVEVKEPRQQRDLTCSLISDRTKRKRAVSRCWRGHQPHPSESMRSLSDRCQRWDDELVVFLSLRNGRKTSWFLFHLVSGMLGQGLEWKYPFMSVVAMLAVLDGLLGIIIKEGRASCCPHSRYIRFCAGLAWRRTRAHTRSVYHTPTTITPCLIRRRALATSNATLTVPASKRKDGHRGRNEGKRSVLFVVPAAAAAVLCVRVG